MAQITAYCMKCRRKVVLQSPKLVKLRNGVYAYRGKCPRCGSTLYRFVGRKRPD